jgi:hypothetical protein
MWNKEMQERSGVRTNRSLLMRVCILGITLSLIIACSIPNELLGLINLEFDRNDELIEAGLQETHSATEEPAPSATTQPQRLEAAPTPSATLIPESTQPSTSPKLYYYVQPGSPVGFPNIWHPELGCDWMGIGGQVFGWDGAPEQKTLVVELGGTIAGQEMSAITLTGTAAQWGRSGYEFTLGSVPVASEYTLWLQFFDMDGNEVSPRIPFNTYDDCERNVILLNLIHVERVELEHIYLPLVGNFFSPEDR